MEAYDAGAAVAKRIGLNVSARTGLCCYNRPMSVYVLALLIGVVAGLRAMTAPAVVSWAAYLAPNACRRHMACFPALHLDTIHLERARACGTRHRSDSRRRRAAEVPLPLRARIVSGGLCGTAFGASGGTSIAGLVAGVIGAVAGTLGGSDSGRAHGRGLAAGPSGSHCLRTHSDGGQDLIVMSFS